MKCFLLVLSLLLTGVIHAQTYNYGELPDTHFELDIYPKDSSASAVVLFDHGDTRIIYTTTYKLSFKRHKRFKIFTDEGLSEADISIRFRKGSREQEIRKLKAHSYYKEENGEIITTELDKDEMYEKEISEYWSEITFSLPGVRKGSIIEFSYELSSESLPDFPTWYFQTDIPTMWSEYVTTIPEWFKYLTVTRGFHEYSVQESKDIQVNRPGLPRNMKEYRYVMEDVPAIKNEPFMNAKNDYLAHVIYQLSSIEFPDRIPEQILESWPEVITDLLKNRKFGKRLGSSKRINTELLWALDGIGEKSPLDKMRAIYNYVANAVEWNGEYGVYLDYSLDEYIEQGSGSGSAINMMLIQLLREAGFESHPVLVSTRSNGEIVGMFPFANQFNHTIAYVAVGDTYYLLDAKNKHRPYNLLPSNLVGTNGLLIYEPDLIWLPVNLAESSSNYRNIVLNITENGYEGILKGNDKGFYAMTTREFIDEDAELSTAMKKSLFGESSFVQIDSSVIVKDEFSGVLNYEVYFSEERKDAAEVIYFNPMVVDKMDSNPFNVSDRSYPIDYPYPFDEFMVMTIMIPDGYTVDELPKPVLYRLPEGAGEFRRIIQTSGNSIQMQYRYKINKSRFMPQEYDILKAMYDEMVTRLGENIVLKKG